MHVVGQFRYGSASKSQPFNFASAGGGTTVSAAGSQKLREDHWLVDFGIGRDFGLGNTHAMWTLGVRVADLRSKLTASGSFHATTTTPASPTGLVTTTNVFAGTFSAVQKSTFVGAGPRFGVQGDIPLGGQWSIDWLAGAAVLFGERTLQFNAGPVGANASDTPAVFNLDAQAGLSYWFSPNTKFTVGYRFDGYFKALKTFDTAGNITNVDRLFNGPMARLTWKY
jgi:Legionella pneumophila major outer membrane protein precursor